MQFTTKSCIIFCGQSSFPLMNSAAANRYRAIADTLKIAGYEIIFSNRIGLFNPEKDVLIDRSYDFIAPTGNFRSKNFIKRTILKIVSPFLEAKEIYALSKKKDIKYISSYTELFLMALWYEVIASFLGASCIHHLVEIRSSMENRSLIYRINDYLFENLICRSNNSKFIAISENTANLVRNKSNKNVYLLPPIFDFSLMNDITLEEGSNERFFLYCASMEYESVAWFVIQAFNNLNTKDIKLYLILNGQLSDRIKLAVDHSCGIIKVFSAVKYADLLRFYKSAVALLIPLRNTKQDISRFPQKISEYTASGRPIITTSFGEMSNYFNNGKNCLMANSFDIDEYAGLMMSVIENQKLSDEIGYQGKINGLKFFDLKSHVDSLKNFLG